MKNKQNHNIYYLFQSLIILLGIIAVLVMKGQIVLQMTALGAVALFYVVLALLHHFIHHTLTIKIVLEYILIGVLGVSIFWFLLSGL